MNVNIEKITSNTVFQNGIRIILKDHVKNNLKRTIVNNYINYKVENSAIENRNSNHKPFPELIHECEIVPESYLNNQRIVNRNIIVTYEKICKEFFEEGLKINTEVRLYTQIDVKIILLTVQSEMISINRTLISNGILKANEIKRKIELELDSFLKEYMNYMKKPIVSADPNEYDIILPSGRGGIFIHEAIGHAMEGDLLFGEDNILSHKVEHRITVNSEVSISDVCEEDLPINYKVSDEGTAPVRVNLIEKGYFCQPMGNLETERIYGCKDTGNGRAATGRDIPIVRMRNTFLHNGKQNLSEIINTTKKGIIATEISGGNVVLANGNFVFNVSAGILIINGNKVGLTKPFLFTGNILSALDSIDMIGNDLSFFSALCNKKGQLVNVSYGQPTIRIAKREKKWNYC